MIRRLIYGICMTFCVATSLWAQSEPLKLKVTSGIIEPLTFAIAPFEAQSAQAQNVVDELVQVITDDLNNTGLFRSIPPSAFIAQRQSFEEPVRYPDWRALNTRALITGAISVSFLGNLTVKFRVFDIDTGRELGNGAQLSGSGEAIRRIGHQVADQVYARITGEDPYFDSRIVFITESGPKDNRLKRLAIMDYDGANVEILTGGNDTTVLAPRLSKDGRQVLYTSYLQGVPQIYLLDLARRNSRALPVPQNGMSFAPRFSPNAQSVVYSYEQGGNTDLYLMDLSTGRSKRLTNAPSIETAPSFSPDGQNIVFESDRSGTQQLYIMPVSGGSPKRISFGEGRYGTPVWSPRGDLIAFTKQTRGRFGIGVMRIDGSEERLISASFLDEAPTWSPNGRVIMFTRETQGPSGAPSLYSVDITGRNLRPLGLSAPASDAAWGPLLQ